MSWYNNKSPYIADHHGAQLRIAANRLNTQDPFSIPRFNYHCRLLSSIILINLKYLVVVQMVPKAKVQC
jgi:hypothetical protein